MYIQIIPATGFVTQHEADPADGDWDGISTVVAWALTSEGEVVPLVLCDDTLSDPRDDGNFIAVVPKNQ